MVKVDLVAKQQTFDSNFRTIGAVVNVLDEGAKHASTILTCDRNNERRTSCVILLDLLIMFSLLFLVRLGNSTNAIVIKFVGMVCLRLI